MITLNFRKISVAAKAATATTPATAAKELFIATAPSGASVLHNCAGTFVCDNIVEELDKSGSKTGFLKMVGECLLSEDNAQLWALKKLGLA